MRTENFFPKIISYLFHPLLLPAFGLMWMFNLAELDLWFPTSGLKIFLFVSTLTATFFLPLLNALLLLRFGLIASLEMKTRQERKIPYLVSAIFYSAESYFLMHADVPLLAKALMLGATLVVISVLLVNFFWKISAHMAGIGGLIGMMISVSYRLQIDLHFVLITLFLIAGSVAFSRLKLSAHTPAEVYAGFLLGVFIELALFIPFEK